MNLADAVRAAALRAQNLVETESRAAAEIQIAPVPQFVAPKAPIEETAAPKQGRVRNAKVKTEPGVACDAVTGEPVYVPQTPSAETGNGNVVRLELFLSPEQLRGLFQAVVGTQHSIMTLREASSYLRIHPSTLEQMAHAGEAPAIELDGRLRFPKANLDEWVTLQSFKNGGIRDVA